jgi:hypothetical protein
MHTEGCIVLDVHMHTLDTRTLTYTVFLVVVW